MYPSSVISLENSPDYWFENHLVLHISILIRARLTSCKFKSPNATVINKMHTVETVGENRVRKMGNFCRKEGENEDFTALKTKRKIIFVDLRSPFKQTCSGNNRMMICVFSDCVFSYLLYLMSSMYCCEAKIYF